MNSNYKVISMPDERSTSLCVRGSAFSNRRCRSSTGSFKDSGIRECEVLVRRTVSFINTKWRDGEPSERFDCTGKGQNRKKEGNIPRASKSAKVPGTESSVYTISKQNELKRSKSEAALKVNTKISVEKTTVSDIGGHDNRRLSSALKRKESFTRGDIMSDQNENAIDNVKRLSKFKLDIKVGVRNDHYNQWARRKKSESLSLSTNVLRGDPSSRTSAPSPTRVHDIQQNRCLSIPRKGSASKRCTKYLNFENFNTIFNDIQTEKQRIHTTMKLGNRGEAMQGGGNRNSLKESGELKDNGNRYLRNSGREEQIPVPRISVDNVLIKDSESKKNKNNIAKNKLGTIEKDNSSMDCKKDGSGPKTAVVEIDDWSERRNKTDNTKIDAGRRNKIDNSEIEAVYKANSVYMEVPKLSVNDECSSDDDFDKTPIIDGETVSKTKSQNKDTILSKYLSKADKNTKSKTQFSPVKQDILSSFEIKTNHPLRIIIKDNFYRLSKAAESLNEAKQRVTSAITRHTKSITTITDKDGKLPKKIPLKLATQSPILTTQSVENGFAHMRIEQHLQNLKLRVQSQNSARSSPFRFNNDDRESVPPSRDGRPRNESENCYKQTCISINEQVNLTPKHSIGLLNYSATNCNKLRNKVGEILPFGRLSTGNRIWNLSKKDVL